MAVSDLPPRRTPAVVVACQACRSRKIKCDGNRPACGPCCLKARTCEYRVDIGLSRREHMEKKHQALQEGVESFSSLYRYLQSRPADEANGLFERIRNGFTLESALEFAKDHEELPEDQEELPEDQENSPSISGYRSSSYRLEWSPQIHDCNQLFEHELLSGETSDAVKQALHDGIACFFSYLGTMFPVITENEVATVMTTFLAPLSESEGTIESQVVNKKIAYGELLAICALGFQYDRQNLPDGNSSICTPFYQKARLFLDYVVEEAPLRAMRMCCYLGIYNVLAKSSLAVSYTGKLPAIMY